MEEPDCEEYTETVEELPLGIYICSMCGFRYDEARGSEKANLAPGTRWSDVPDSFKCPVCGCPKNIYRRYHDARH